MKVIGWLCWYDNDEVYNSKDYTWEELPDDGLLIKMIYYDNGTKQIQHGMDYFYEAPHKSGETIRGTGNDLEDIEERYPGAIIKRGRWAPDSYYQNMVEKAMKVE